MNLIGTDNRVDLTGPGEKIFAGVLGVGALIGLYYLLPPLVYIFLHAWILAVMGVFTALVVMQRNVIWGYLKILSWKASKALIKKNKIEYMWLYHEHIMKKIDNLATSINSMTTVKVMLVRQLTAIRNSLDQARNTATRMEAKTVRTGDEDLDLRSEYSKIRVNDAQLKTFEPHYDNVVNQEKYLSELLSLWRADAKDLKYNLEAKEKEYETMKVMAEATGQAAEFLKGNSDQYKMFQQSLKEIETSVSQYTAQLETFDRDVQPVLRQLRNASTVNEDDGKRLLETYNQQRLQLPS